MITVFTPTYNRGHLLPVLHESLCRQKFMDFEWIVVDDGSMDNTQEVMRGIMEENHGFAIRYYRNPNGGKHRAVNLGVKEAKGELFFIADSDDQLTDDSLQMVAEVFEGVRNNPEIGGVCGLDCLKDGTLLGSGLPCETIDCNALEIRYKHHVTGDLKEVFRTRVLIEFPFPEIEGERFSPEALTWNRIAAKYQLRYFNKPIYVADYQPDGLTSRIVRIRQQSPIASMLCYKELTEYDVPLKEKVKAAINYWRFRLCAHGGQKPKMRWYWNLFMPVGRLMYLRDGK